MQLTLDTLIYNKWATKIKTMKLGVLIYDYND